MNDLSSSTDAFSDTARVLHNGREFKFVHSDPEDHIFSILRNSRAFYEIALLDRLASLVKPASIAIDVGANIGNHAIYFAGVMGCKVVALEPNPKAAALLRRNAELNGLSSQIDVRECAGGAERRKGRVAEGQAHNLGTSTMLADPAGDIEIVPLDHLAIEGDVGLVKIDVEGMESEVLRGARELLSKHRPVLAIEASSAEDYLRVVGEIAPLGYLPLGSYNYTPTHIFTAAADQENRPDISAHVAHRLSLQYIDAAGQTAKVDTKLSQMRDQLRQLAEAVQQAQGEIAATAALETRIAGISKSTGERLAEIEARGIERLGELDSRFAERLAEIGEGVRGAAIELAALSPSIAELNAGLEALSGAVTAQGAQHERDFGALRALEQQLCSIKESATAHEIAVDERLRSLGEAIAGVAHDHAERLQAMTASSANLLGAFERRLGQLEALLVRSSEDHGRALQSIGVAASDRMSLVEGRLAGIEKAIVRAEQERANALSVLSAAATDRMAPLEARLLAIERGLAVADKARDDALVGLRAAMEDAQGLARTDLAAMRADLTRLRTQLGSAEGRIMALDAHVKGTRAPDLSTLEASVCASARSIAEIEQAVAGISERQELSKLQFEKNTDLLLELQMLGGADIDSKLAGLESRLGGVMQRQLDERLTKDLEQRLSRMGAQLAEAIGVAVADGRLSDEIASSESPLSVAQSLALLGIPLADDNASNASNTPRGESRPPPGDHASPAQADGRGQVWYVKGFTPTGLASKKDKSKPQPATLAEIDLSEGWENKGWAQGASLLEAGGRVAAKVACPRLGFVGPAINCENGGLIEIEVEIGGRTATQAAPVLQLQTETGFAVGHDFPLNDGTSVIRAFAPHRTRRLKPYVVMLDAPAGASYKVGKLIVRRISAEAHHADVRSRVKEMVLASMATIPSRREMLRDCVNSLLVQCDRVRVFLNNYPDVPEFLKHPRVEVRRSQDWDDRGDAGKFFWIDKDRAEGGYRLIIDDDLIFPPDFVDVMTQKVAATGKRGIFATHGVLLRQPIVRYYQPTARAATFHFGGALPMDRGVHIGGTAAMCFHSSAVEMRWDDFKYCNSADVWLSLYAQRHQLPVLTPARPKNWVRENEHAVPTETIYQHSLKRTRTRFDSSHVQDAVLRHAWPLTLNTAGRSKIAVAIEVRSANALASSLPSWITHAQSRAGTSELVLIVGYDGTDEALVQQIGTTVIPYETHLVDVSRDGVDFASGAAALHARLRIDATIIVPDTVRPLPALSSSAGTSGCSATQTLVAGSSLTIGPQRITAWLDAHDERELAVTLETGEAGATRLESWLGTSRLMAGEAPEAAVVGATPGPSRRPLSERVAKAITAMKGQSARATKGISTKRPHSVNSVFTRVIVLNLDRRPDRWQVMSASLARAGITAERFSAVDGTNPKVAKEYERYAAKPLVAVSAEIPAIKYSADLYMNYASQAARVAHLEGKSGKKAIQSAGAWGYLRSYEAILERSLEEQDETLLVLDDDVRFHKDFAALFDLAVEQLPADWLIVQLGTLQYNWEPPWAEWRTKMLYQTNGGAIGSHAVGMRFEVLPYLLDHTKRMDLPYDVGPLSAATRAFPDRCFVVYPNLAIQALDGSDIGTSDFQKSRSREESAEVYRWRLADYDL